MKQEINPTLKDIEIIQNTQLIFDNFNSFNTLNNFWENITDGGIIVFDEYAHQKWTETRGVDKFIKEKKVKIKTLNYIAPTAFISKNYENF